MALLPATVITPVSIIVPVTLEALVASPFLPLALSIAQPKETLTFTLSPERILPVTVMIIVAIIPLSFGLRPAGDAGAGYESYS
jgi:hypothetical protein